MGGREEGQAGAVMLCVLASGRSVDTAMEEVEGCWRDPIISAASKDSRNDSSTVCPVLSGELSCSACPSLRDPGGCDPPGSSVHRIFKARILEWVAPEDPRETDPGTKPASPALVDGFLTTEPTWQLILKNC